jgi:hypothetical protein
VTIDRSEVLMRLRPLVLGLLLFCACKSEVEPPRQAQGAPLAPSLVQVPMGRAPQAIPGLVFTITEVYRGTRPSSRPPWHEPGGEWTFFDCALANDATIRFTVGTKGALGARGFGFGRAALVAPDAATGARLVARFAAAFGAPSPPPRAARPLSLRPFASALLGVDGERIPGGGFRSRGGTWTATKWFLQREGLEAEVFFNYSLAEKRGEFSEKDAAYAVDLVKGIALLVRDGLPEKPER